MKALADILSESALVVRETGQWILQQSSQFTSSDIIYKGTNDLVSFVDQQAEAKLKLGLSAIFPEAQFIAEETSSNYAEVGDGYYWVIDPLDGTTNFLHKLPVFAVSVGLIYQKQPILGLIYEPNRDELFTAAKGNGAHLNGKPIQVSP